MVVEMEQRRPQTLEVDDLPAKEWWRQEELGVTMMPVAVGVATADCNNRLSIVPHVRSERANQRASSHVCRLDRYNEGKWVRHTILLTGACLARHTILG